MSVAWVEPRRMGVTSISRGVWRDGRVEWIQPEDIPEDFPEQEAE